MAKLVALGVIGRNSSYLTIVNVVLELVYLQRESATGRRILPVIAVISLANGFVLAVKLVKCYTYPLWNYM